MTVKRNIPHDSRNCSETIASGSFIRECFNKGENYRNYVPAYTETLLNTTPTAQFSNLERIILYQIRKMTEQEFLHLPDMNDSLSGRFRKACQENSLEKFLHEVKTKCVTMARIRRILLYALTDIRKEDFRKEIPYARILAFNRKGTEILSQIRKSSIPCGTSLAHFRGISAETDRFLQIATRTADVYGLAQENISGAEADFRRKISLSK